MMEKRWWEGAGLGPNILILKLSSLGDILQSFPVLEYLRERFPKGNFDWVVEEGGKELLIRHPEVREVIVVNTKKWRKSPFSKQTLQEFKNARSHLQSADYDLILDLQGNAKSALFTWMAKGAHKVGFGRKSVPESLNLLVTNFKHEPPSGKSRVEDYLSLTKSFFQDTLPFHPKKGASLALSPEEETLIAPFLEKKIPTALVAMGSFWDNKRLATKTWIPLLKKAQATCPLHFVFIYGSEQEKKEAETAIEALPGSVLFPKSPLPVLQGLMARVDYVFSVDSLALHLAGTTKTPTFGIFGPSLAKKYNPKGIQNAYQAPCPYKKTFEVRCPHLRTCENAPCLKKVALPSLEEALLSFLSGKNQ